MAKRIQLVLNQDVNKLGKQGDLVEVAPGYARNYLLPQKIGVIATPGILKQVERRRAKIQQQLAEQKAQAIQLKQQIEQIGRFSIAKQVGEQDAIFGTVTQKELAEAIQKTVSTEIEIDRRGINLPDINKLGVYNAEIKLHPEVVAIIQVEVIALTE